MGILSKLFPQNEHIGIHMRYGNTLITVGSYRDAKVKIEWQKVIENLELENFYKNNLEPYVSEIITSLPFEFYNRSLPVRVALPDPLIQFEKLNFSNFPTSYKEQSALVNWQFAKASHLEAEKYHVAWQMAASNNSETTALAFGIEKEIINILENMFEKRGYQLDLVNPASYYRFNMLGKELERSGVLLAVEKEYWTLMIWNAKGELSYIYSALRESLSDKDIPMIVAEAERLIWSYMKKNDSVETIFITATGHEKTRLTAEVNARLENECQWLTIPGVSNVKFKDSGLVDLATIIEL